MPDFASYLERCLNREILPEADVLALLWRAMELLSEEPTVIPISSAPSLNVCGDVHGQFYDVRYMFEFGGRSSMGLATFFSEITLTGGTTVWRRSPSFFA